MTKDSKSKNQKLFIEKLTNTAKLPTRAYAHDAGLDLYADEEKTVVPGDRAIVKTGLKLAIPAGCVGLVWDKGGVAKDGVHTMAGVIDAGFRGEMVVTLINLSDQPYTVKNGQKVAQLLIQKVEFPEIVGGKIDDKTERQDKMHGSSGKF